MLYLSTCKSGDGIFDLALSSAHAFSGSVQRAMLRGFVKHHETRNARWLNCNDFGKRTARNTRRNEVGTWDKAEIEHARGSARASSSALCNASEGVGFDKNYPDGLVLCLLYDASVPCLRPYASYELLLFVVCPISADSHDGCMNRRSAERA